MLEEVRRAVGFDAYVWLLTDPETSVGSSPLAEVPCVTELPRLIRLKYLTVVNRWTTLDAGSVGRLREATDGDLTRSLLWRELLVGYDVGDIASLVFRDAFGCWGFLDLWRCDPAAGFGEDEASFLAEVLTPVTGALRRCQADSFVARSPDEVRRHGPVVLLLSPQLDILGQTPETREYLRVLVPTSEDRVPVPASAYNVAAQLLAHEAGVDASPPYARVHLSDGLWLTLRAARIGDADEPGDRNIAVTIQEASPTERVDLFARAFGLTPRESELLRHVATGVDTRELAGRMFLSEHTVQDHLKSVFAKTSTHSRRALLSLALGT